MREIKFRAWDGEGMSEFDLDGGKYFHEKNYPIMQYTGLKDSTGKDVYEEDIITVKSFDRKIGKVFINVKVYFYNGAFGYFYPHLNDFISFSECELKNKSITEEVIGNFYQNPKLLENE